MRDNRWRQPGQYGSRIPTRGKLGQLESQEGLHSTGSQTRAINPSSANSVQLEGQGKKPNMSVSAFSLAGTLTDLRDNGITPHTPGKHKAKRVYLNAWIIILVNYGRLKQKGLGREDNNLLFCLVYTSRTSFCAFPFSWLLNSINSLCFGRL